MADGQRAGLHCREDRAFATDIGLKPLTTPVRSPQNGMAERFVKTIKRDDVAFMPKPDAATTVCSATLLSRSSTTTGRLRVYIAVRAWTVLPTWSTRSLKASCETSGTPVPSLDDNPHGLRTATRNPAAGRYPHRNRPRLISGGVAALARRLPVGASDTPSSGANSSESVTPRQ